MRRFAFAMPFLAVPLAAAACGGSRNASTTTAPSGDPLAAVKGAALKTTESGSEHVELSGRIVATGQKITFTGSGEVDSRAHLSSLSADLSAGGINAALGEVSQGTNVYVRGDLLTAFLPAGKTWLKIDTAKFGKSAGAGLSSLFSQDPVASLTQLQSLRDVTKVGETQLDGASVTHYRGRIDLSVLTGTTVTGVGRYDVWVGRDGYVHRVKALVANGGTTSTVTADLSKFGESVSIDVPPAAETETYSGHTLTIPGLGG